MVEIRGREGVTAMLKVRRGELLGSASLPVYVVGVLLPAAAHLARVGGFLPSALLFFLDVLKVQLVQCKRPGFLLNLRALRF